jgi:precorrin-6B methylase 2
MMRGIEEVMQHEMQRWLERDGERFLVGIGLRSNDMVLDFGCGEGVYSIPAAKLVGTGGIVYALDRDRHSLRSVMEKAAAFGTANIVTVIDPDMM